MNHNQWPEWIRVRRDDIFPRGFLTRPSSRTHVATANGGVGPLKLPRFPGGVTRGLHNGDGHCCGAALSPGHLPPAASLTERLLLG